MTHHTRTTDLDSPASPEGIPQVLRYAAEKMREQNAELEAAWQDKGAGNVWSHIATELERTAVRVEKIIARHT